MRCLLQAHGFQNTQCYLDPTSCEDHNGWNSSQNDVSPQKLFDLATYTFEDMIKIKESYITTNAPPFENTTDTLKIYYKGESRSAKS